MTKTFIAGKLPFFQFDDDMMVYQDGSLGAGFKLTGFDISCIDPSETNQFVAKIESLLVGLPEKVRLQIFYKLGNISKGLIDKHADASDGEGAEYRPIKEARMKFLYEKERDERFYSPEIYFFIRSPGLALNHRKFFEKNKTFDPVPEREFKIHRDKFLILVAQVESSLRAAKLLPEKVNKDDWHALLFSYFNYERAKTVGIPNLRSCLEDLAPSLNAQICLTEMLVKDRELKIA